MTGEFLYYVLSDLGYFIIESFPILQESCTINEQIFPKPFFGCFHKSFDVIPHFNVWFAIRYWL